MRENLVYHIYPVANGFIVQVPFTVNPFDGLKALVPGADPMLQGSPEEKTKDENTFIFDSLEHALAFLHKHLSK